MRTPLPPVAPSYDPNFAADLYAIRGPSAEVKAFAVGAATFLPLQSIFGILAVFPAMIAWAIAMVAFRRAKRAS